MSYALVPGRWPGEDVFSATAARMSAFNALSSILSPSWKSMARLVLPSRLELKRREGSCKEAPLAKVIFTTFLYVSPVQIIPACDHTGTPLHFHSSTTSGSACLMRIRSLASVAPRQSLSSLILASISCEGESSPLPSFEPLFVVFMGVVAFQGEWCRGSIPRRPDGASGTRTRDLRAASATLSQLSYSPKV